MEVMLLYPRPDGKECPPPAQLHTLGPNESWANAPELGTLGPIFDQDTANMPRIQAGLKTTRRSGIMLGHYQESRIRYMHHVLDQYVNAED
jgi:hypothetical protein